MSEQNQDPFRIFNTLFKKNKTASDFKPDAAASKFLNEIEDLDYCARIKKIIELGSNSISANTKVAQQARQIIEQLEQGHFYERHLALVSCASSRDVDRIKRFCQDCSSQLRRLAAILAVNICDDAFVHELLLSLKLKLRRLLLKRLWRARRFELIDKFINSLAERSEADFKVLLYFASPSVLQKHLPMVEDQMTPADVERFAYQHPDLCLDYLANTARKCKREDPRLLGLFWGGSKWLAELRPDRFLEIFELMSTLYPVSRLPYAILMSKRPEQLFKLFLKHADFAAINFSKVMPKLSEETLLLALNNRQFSSNLQTQLRKLSPALRQKAFEICVAAWRNHDGAVSPFTLEQLPPPTRQSEARKHILLPNLAARVNERLNYIRLLDWESLKSEAAVYINTPDPLTRGQGLFSLVYGIKFNRNFLAEALETLQKKKNEADPVREQFLSALSLIPPSTFKTQNLEALKQLFDDALKAQDLSFGSLSNIGRILVRLYPFHKAWVSEQLGRLLRERGPFFLTGHRCNLLDEDVKALSKTFSSIVDYWILHERESEICALARWLCKRLPHSTELCEALKKLAIKAKESHNSETALRILYDFSRADFNELLPKLLDSDRSWSLKPLIYEYLGRKRQSLLTPYLGQTAFGGRFATGKTRLVPDFENGFHKWTSKQLRIYSHELALLAEKDTDNFFERYYGIRRLCLVPEPDVEVLQKLAETTNKNEALRSATIIGLAHCDNGAGLPILLECLNDERASKAIYALRSSLLNMPSNAALSILKSVPQEKVTVSKEIIRLAGDTRSPEALSWLLELDAANLHRDVRVALLRALWNFPEQKETWNILSKTLESGDSAFVDMVIRMPTNGLSTKSRDNVLHLYKQALSSENGSSRLKTLVQISSGIISDPEKRLADALATCLQSKSDDECRSASCTACRLYSIEAADQLEKYLLLVIGSPRNLRIYLQQLKLKFSEQRTIFSSCARRLVDIMKPYPLTLELSVDLSGNVLPWMEFAEILETLETNGQLHFGAMQAACQLLSQQSRNHDTAELDKLEQKFRKDSSANLRRLGLAALCGISIGASGWTEDLLARLGQYRADPTPMVASAATFTLPSAELVSK
jgi:hypothetical protein